MNPSKAPEFLGCSIAIKCADDPLLERCLDSIDDPTVAVNAVITPSDQTESLLREREIPFVVTEYGNIAKSAQLSVDTAEHDNVIVMDSDAYFMPGAIRKLREALTKTPVAKPRLEFLDDGSYISRVIAASRQSYNALPDNATNPGLALRRTEIAERCGYIFNPLIRWTEDADLNYRLKLHDVPMTYVPEAIICHDLVSLSHELKCAFLYGVGKRLSVENTPGRPAIEEFSAIAQRALSGETLKEICKTAAEKDLGSLALATIWRTLYLTGYHAQRQTGRWAVPS
jgi:GT2 family glycosyltransferase